MRGPPSAPYVTLARAARPEPFTGPVEPTLPAIEIATTGTLTYKHFADGQNYVFILLQEEIANRDKSRLIALPTRW